MPYSPQGMVVCKVLGANMIYVLDYLTFWERVAYSVILGRNELGVWYAIGARGLASRAKDTRRHNIMR